MSVIQNNLLMTPEGYQISRSVRLRSSASAYFNRTPAGAGNRRTWTWSSWVKRGKLGADQDLFGYYASGINESIRFGSNDTLYRYCVDTSGTVNRVLLNTNAVYRDTSAWYHIMVVQDTTQATNTDRVKIYVNSVQQSVTASVWPSLNWDGYFNTVVNHQLFGSSGLYFDGLQTETYFIDGQALTPSSFGETDAVTGVWKPKKYTGTYGTNGFYLNFSDNSNNTAATIGKDSSGNGNNWTPNNISVTSGSTYDSMLDVPTPYADGGNGRGNYCTLNPLFTGGAALTNANLYAQSTSAAYKDSTGTIQFPSSGKWYFESTIVSNNGSGNNQGVGISASNGSFFLDCFATSSTSIRKSVDGVASGSYGTASNGTVIGVAVDADNGKAYLAVNNTWIDSSSPTGGTGGYSLLAGQQYAPYFRGYNSGQNAFNFGQQSFSYTPPTGFKALNTQNLPDATIKKGNQYFDATLYTGTGSSQSIINTASMQPDLVWVKGRSGATDHAIYDAVRGVQLQLESNTTTAETTETTGLTAFNSNGFTVGALAQMNTSSATYVGWQWKESVTAGFDIVTYTAPASGSFSVNHSLGVAPAMVISKTRGSTGNWGVWHKSLASGTDSYLNLNTTQSVQTQSGIWGSGHTSTTTGGLVGWSDAANTTAVRYLFAEVAGFSKFGSYTGNGSTDGPFVYCGFRPRYVMVKRTDNTSPWLIYDTSRDTYNQTNNLLRVNTSQAETTSGEIDILSNGFKYRGSSTNADYVTNVSGATYIYATFAENPFKNSLAR